MGQNELLAKLDEIKELQVMQAELEAQLDALKKCWSERTK